VVVCFEVYSEAFFGVLQIVSPQWSRFWYTELIDVAISLHDFRDHLPNLGFSVFNRLSKSVLKIIILMVIKTLFYKPCTLKNKKT
jgi:hypothetical protein